MGAYAKAQAVLACLAQDEAAAPGASGRRRRARQESAARDRLVRVRQALAALEEIEAQRAARETGRRGKGTALSADRAERAAAR